METQTGTVNEDKRGQQPNGTFSTACQVVLVAELMRWIRDDDQQCAHDQSVVDRSTRPKG